MWGAVDFARRDFVPDASWPLGYDEIEPYFARAATWMRIGRPAFDLSELPHLRRELVPGLTDDGTTTSTLERWSLPTNFSAVYGNELKASTTVRLVTGLTATKVLTDPQSQLARGVECRQLGRRTSVPVVARRIVIAAGGLESTRLLMESEAPTGGQLGDHSGHLGRWYMGHLEGVVAELRFATDPRGTSYDYERDIDGVYVRRRFGFRPEYQIEHRLPNVCGWLANPRCRTPPTAMPSCPSPTWP